MKKTVALAPAVLLAVAGSGLAQDGAAPATQPADSRIDRVEQRLNEMDKKYQADLQARDAEIERLKQELANRPAAPATSQAANGQPAGDSAGLDDIGKSTQEMLKDIDSKSTAAPIVRVPANFNPNIAVISDFAGNTSTDYRNPARNYFDLREVELDFRAAVDPRADAVVILPIDRSQPNPLFFDPAHANGHIDTSIDIEEAYLYLHDFGVPNLTAKVGRFHVRFGRWNILHLHAWPTVDNAFAVQNYLGPESLADSGISLSYVIPPKLLNGEYVEVDAEVLAGLGSTDNPVLNNDAYVNNPAVNLHALWNHDLSPDWNFELGASYLHGHHNSDNLQSANLYGTDFTLIHTDPLGRFNNQLFQVEAIYGDVDRARHDTQHSVGGFALAQQQLGRDWYTGVRLDWTKDALDEHREVWGVSPYLTWYWSEFLRFRVEYQHKQGDTPVEDTFWFQVDWVFGAHPPHPYWSMK